MLRRLSSHSFNRLSPSTRHLRHFSVTQSQTLSDDDVHNVVSKYYGETLKSSDDCKTSICGLTAPHQRIRDIIKQIPDEVVNKFYGCGNPIPFGIHGLNILDLGSGSGRDCYITAALVGEEGHIIGVDMTEEQLRVARNNAESYCKETLGYGKTNMEFRKGLIENLQDPQGANIPEQSIDIVISNCVVNLSPRKTEVLQSVYNSLRDGGEFYFSDMYCDRRIAQELKENELLIGEGYGGALFVEDFHDICHQVGFTDPRVLTRRDIVIQDEELKSLVGDANFYSITYRLFKNTSIEQTYKIGGSGVNVTYKGTIEEDPEVYKLDENNSFPTNEPQFVSTNTAKMISNSWLRKYFDVQMI